LNRLISLLKIENLGNMRSIRFLCSSMTATDSRIRQIESLLPKAMARDRADVRRSLASLRHADGGPPGDRVLDRIEARLAASVAARERRRIGLPPRVFPEALPITAKKD